MRLRAVYSIKQNDRLAKAIYNENGQVLVQAGIPLSNAMISRLKAKGITFAYVDDDVTSDIYFEEVITEQTRHSSINTIKKSFQAVTAPEVLKKSFEVDKVSRSFGGIVSNILHDVRKHKEAISLLSSAYCYDSYIFHHSLNVTVYALALGERLGLNEGQLKDLGLGSLLHDIGKMAVPTEVLHKKNALTDEEFAVIKEHTTAGYELLRKTHTIPLLSAHCAYQHHERLNGSGYPRGIGGDEIHLYGKIIGIADVFDAVTSNRIYRKARLPHEGLELLYAGADNLFDKKMVEVFAKTVAIYPVGLEVVLNDGRQGVVSKQNKNMNARPVIRILQEAGRVVFPYEVDLTKELNITIVKCEARLSEEEAS
ncbi:HD-GYP domain-containing protein [Bacillus sp. H-16]|uniref:HD-GYP domain-containing protein n=1 Tax=Alteribacter salitolerans TaxID=2912333 RepID=UPI0019642A8B|nr:HD-GYP domain-containing protein [Alteribacter salitolerans]MBM7096995.1 HD-GYP domain-containing protein [Alteribacter salitolerans]